ncbi:MAG: LicD family protein [Planctomycetes bacterium]|nr:LicD family protein [Planctomycetota bacterium]
MRAKQELLKTILFDAVDVLTNNDAAFWLSAGTLLGFVRDGGLIEWEDDIDIDTWKKDNDLRCKKKLAADFKKLGYKTYFTDSHLNIRKAGEAAGPYLDINFHERVGDEAVLFRFVPRRKFATITKKLLWSLYDINNLRWQKSNLKDFVAVLIITLPAFLFHLLPTFLRQKVLTKAAKIRNTSFFTDCSMRFPTEFVDELKCITFFGHDMLIPKNPEGYLEHKYGPTWREPNRNWDTSTQDRSIVGNNVAHSETIASKSVIAECSNSS